MQTTKLWVPHLQHLERYRQEEAGKPRSSELPTGWHHPSREQKIEGKLCREEHATTAHVRCGVARIVWRGSSIRHVHRDPLNRSLSPNPKDWTSSPALTWTSRDEPPSVQSALQYKIDEGAHDGKMGSLWSAFTYQLRWARDNLLFSWAPFKHEQPGSRSTTSVLKYKVEKCSTISLIIYGEKSPKGDTYSKIWRFYFFFQRQVAKLGESRHMSVSWLHF